MEKRIKITFQLSLQRLLTIINSSEIFLMPQCVNFMENLKIPNKVLDKMNKLC